MFPTPIRVYKLDIYNYNFTTYQTGNGSAHKEYSKSIIWKVSPVSLVSAPVLRLELSRTRL